jgi:hypothetical protein
MRRGVLIVCALGGLGAGLPLGAAGQAPESRLSVLAPLVGDWSAAGTGFTSRLVYEWALPGTLLRARNEVRNAGGDLVGQYEGLYAWDAAAGRIVFFTAGRGGELHRGYAEWRDGRLWHDATVVGGQPPEYRSALQIVGSELHYRAKYAAGATDREVLESQPLVYTRTRR